MSRSGIAIALPLAWISGCIDTSTVLDPVGLSQDPALLEMRARREYAVLPRSEVNVVRAFQLMREAARATDVKAPERLGRLADAARYSLWVARHGEESQVRSGHADAAIVICNTAVRDGPDRVEGYYYRAVATGLFAQENSLYGPDAMSQIRADGLCAVDLDPAFDSGGPHRVLGGLYLHAPGPPAGVGSIRRAIVELEAAVRIAPDHPQNMLFLATAYVEAEREPEEVARLIERLPRAIEEAGEEADRVAWRRELSELRARVEGQDARLPGGSRFP